MNHKIKVLLVRRKIKQKDIAKELGVTPGMISGVISGDLQSHRVKLGIAEALKIPYTKLWGRAA